MVGEDDFFANLLSKYLMPSEIFNLPHDQERSKNAKQHHREDNAYPHPGIPCKRPDEEPNVYCGRLWSHYQLSPVLIR